MKTANYLIGLAATALLGSLSVAQAAHLPSPCEGAEVGAGSNCMYLVLNGATNVYDAGTGDRAAFGSSTLTIDVWMDFRTVDVTGGGFDIGFDVAGVSTASWAFDSAFTRDLGFSFDGSLGANGWEAIQFNSQSPNGYGSTGDNPFQLVGALTLTGVTMEMLFNLNNDAYGTATFPSCFAPTSGSSCVPTGMYDLTVAPVPLPAAVWMMLVGLGSLAGFQRRS